MKKLFLTFAVLAGLCCSCSNDETPNDVVPDNPVPENNTTIIELDSRTQQEIAGIGNRFAVNLMNEMLQPTAGRNMMISPMSLQINLGMLSNGADQQALEQITEALGLENYTLDMMNSFYYTLQQSLQREDEDFILRLANSVWVQKEYDVEQAFIDNNRTYFNATVDDIDFCQPIQAKEIINRWAEEATQGTIKELSFEISSLLRVVLANACYLKGKWTLPFDKEDTKAEDFHNQDGTLSKVDMMYLTKWFNYRADSGDPYTMVELPYGDESFSMLIVLPNEGEQLDAVIPQINWTSGLIGQEVHVQLPKFKIESQFPDDIKNAVENLGMKRIFIPGSLPGINEELFVGQITQDSFIEVDEAGTEASAVTTSGMCASAGPEPIVSQTPTIRMDRPFAFAIRQKSTGAILFMGKVVQF